MVDATVARISGPVAVAKDLEGAHMFDVVRIGEMGLMGEIIRLEGNTAQIQVYEDTTGLKPGEKVRRFKFMRIQLVSSQEKKLLTQKDRFLCSLDRDS